MTGQPGVVTQSHKCTNFPDGIDEKNVSGGVGIGRHASPLSILLLGGLILAGLLGVAGGDPSRAIERDFGPAILGIDTPRTLRSGEFFETRVEVRAKADLADVTIAIAPSLWKDMTINTTLPDPADQSFENGLIHWSYGPLKAGETLMVKIDGQINPPLFAGTSGAFFLYDGKNRIGELPFSIRVFP